MFKLRFSSGVIKNPYENYPEIQKVIQPFKDKIGKLDTFHLIEDKLCYELSNGYIHIVNFGKDPFYGIVLSDYIVSPKGNKIVSNLWSKPVKEFMGRFPKKENADKFFKKVFKTLEGKNIKDDIREIVEGVYNGI